MAWRTPPREAEGFARSGTLRTAGSTERVVVSQLVRSPGVFYTDTVDPASGRSLWAAKVIPNRGAWLEFETSSRDIISVNYSIEVVNGSVFLIGVAQSDAELGRVLNTARNIGNVKRVISFSPFENFPQPKFSSSFQASPNQYCVIVPARQLYSHSASVGRR